MLLAINVGNTNTVLGVFRSAELQWQWRISTQRERTADEFRNLLDRAGFALTAIVASDSPMSIIEARAR